MPTYEYECQSCGHRFELFQKMSDKPVRICPKCRKDKVKKLISAGAGFIFKGSGFYATDYKKPPKEKKCDMAGKKPECSSCPASNPKKD